LSKSGVSVIGQYFPPKTAAPLSDEERQIVDRFSSLYYRKWVEGQGTIDLSWLGYKTLKCPLDLWIYQEMIVEIGISLVIECGTRFGGSALFLANIFDMLGHGRVITIDIGDPGNIDNGGIERPVPQHPRIEYLTGSSTSQEMLSAVSALVGVTDKVMVILDSDHSRDHVLAELRAYAPMVTAGSYLIVEDTNINGHPVVPEFGPGPWEAVEQFLTESPDYCVDDGKERFLLTLNPKGFLMRKPADPPVG